MLRYAIYARYSSDNQNERSIDDQVRECKAEVQLRNGTISETHVFADYGISASHMTTRAGILAMMQAAKQNQFDIVLADDLSRVSRDLEDIAGIYKRLTFQEVKMITLFEGEINEMHIGQSGTENAKHLKRLAHHVRRGQRGRVENGRIPGGNCYGYDVVKEFGTDGIPIKGLRTINEEQACIVERIFKEYASGKSPRAIAHQLNREEVPAPRGGVWQPSTLNGNPKRGTGILNNELYIGCIVYNRQRFIKDPDTGKRQARPNTDEERVIKEVPELRIVSEELWETVRERRAFVSRNFTNPRMKKKYLLSGLLKCGCCNGSYVIIGGSKKNKKLRYGCATRKEKGTCTNARTITLHELEERVFSGLKTYLKDPSGLNLFVQEFHKSVRTIKAADAKAEATVRKSLKANHSKIAAIVKAVEDGLYNSAMKERMQLLEEEKTGLQNEIKGFEVAHNQVLEFLPNLGVVYEQYVDNLRNSLQEEATKESSIELLRSMMDRVVLFPKAHEGLSIEIEGRLAAILHFLQGETNPLKRHYHLKTRFRWLREGATYLIEQTS